MTTTEETITPEAKTNLHDKCPLCGFAFPRPQAKCRSEKACQSRQAKNATPKATPETVADAALVKTGKKEAADRQAEADQAAVDHTDEDGGPVLLSDHVESVIAAEDAAPLKVRLSTPPQRLMAAELTTGLRSEVAGANLVVFADEVDEIEARLNANAMGNDSRPRRQTAKAILARMDKAAS